MSRLLALVAVAACAVPLACGGDGPDDPPRASTPAAPATTSPESEVESAYLAYWDMVVRLTASPDPESAEVTDHAVEPMRGRFIDSLSALDSAGQAIRTGPMYAHAVDDIVIDGTQARLTDCGVDDSEVIDAASGQVLQDKLSTELVDVALVLEGESWRVQDITPVETWQGATTCKG